MEVRVDLRRRVGLRVFSNEGKPFDVSAARFELYRFNDDSTKTPVGAAQPVTPLPISKRESLRATPGFELSLLIGPLVAGRYQGRFVYTVDLEDEDYYLDIYATDV